MADSFDFRNTSHFTAGAIGEPGSRVFYLQFGDQHRHVSLKMEKQQAIALAAFLRSVLEDMPAPESEPVPQALVNPVDPAWVIGQIAVGTPENDQILILAEELRFEDDDAEPDPLDFLDDGPSGATCKAFVNSAQAASFVATVDRLVSQSRPPCRICGGPIDPDGHVCPRLN